MIVLIAFAFLLACWPVGGWITDRIHDRMERDDYTLPRQRP